MKLTDAAALAQRGYQLPRFDIAAMRQRTIAAPEWIHFGAGNLFKAFQAHAAQRLLEEGLTDKGVLAVERRRKAGRPAWDQYVKVTLKADGSVDRAVIASVAETRYLYGDEAYLKAAFESPALRMVSFTITEKGYRLRDAEGGLLPDARADMAAAPEAAESYMGRIAALLLARWRAGGAPIAMVSMDNCAHNGDRLREAVTAFAEVWGDEGFLSWLNGPLVSFPWTMIDKITPAPTKEAAALLTGDGLDADVPFVNAEESEYLVIEDDFPNGRPPLEKAGIYFTDRETVDRAERMKVCTCLNPLHTALAVFGRLLGFETIADEMRDADLAALVRGIGEKEGLPVAVDPGIIDPARFLDTVLRTRLPNPFLADTPRRIAEDTSQKLSIRFGETIKAYMASDHLDSGSLRLIPLVFAGWLRYLLAVDDEGRPFDLSPDPLAGSLLPHGAERTLGQKPDLDALTPYLADPAIWGVDLFAARLADRVCRYLSEMCAGEGAVRRTLHEAVSEA